MDPALRVYVRGCRRCAAWAWSICRRGGIVRPILLVLDGDSARWCRGGRVASNVGLPPVQHLENLGGIWVLVRLGVRVHRHPIVLLVVASLCQPFGERWDMSVDGGLHEGSVPFAAHSDYMRGCVPSEGMYAAAVFGARGVPQLPVADVAVQVLQWVLLVLAAEMVNAEILAVAVGPMGAYIWAARHGCSSGTQ